MSRRNLALVGLPGSRSPLNPNGLPVGERLPDVSCRLMMLEAFCHALIDSNSRTGPDPREPEEWADFWTGLAHTIADIREIAEDIYQEAHSDGRTAGGVQ